MPARVTQAAIAEMLFCVRDKFITFGFFRNKTRLRLRLRRRRGERQKSDSGICVYSALAHIESLVSSLSARRRGIQKSLDERASLSRSHLCSIHLHLSRCVQTGSGGLSLSLTLVARSLGFTSLEHFRGALSYVYMYI